MLRAATAPMLFAVPTAVMHWPTFSANGVAVTVLRYLLAEVVMTVTLVSVAAPPCRPPGFWPRPGSRWRTPT